jgi:MYXO-CTERM domain-containing protein
MRYAWALLVMLFVFGAAPPARANGRFPESLRLLEDPRNPEHLVLAGTFGLLVSHDRGKNWYYVCEEAFALAFLEGDPMLEIMPDGTILSGIFETLNRSSDCGCTWQTTLAAATSETVLDISVDGNAAQTVLALVSETPAQAGPAKWRLDESTDGGKTWHKLADLPSSIAVAYTIDIAPSDPTRLYISALSRGESGSLNVLLVSKNRGATWEANTFPTAPIDEQPFIGLVHPTNPDVLFVRTDQWLPDVNPSANDALFVSTDGGKTWRETLRKGGKLFGVQLSPDGKTVVAGYGDPRQASGRSTETADLGIYKASTTDYAFQKIYDGPTSCLRWTKAGLYSCNIQYFPDGVFEDFALGLAPNADFALGSKPFTTLLNLKDVRGPLTCVQTACKTTWASGTNGAPAVCEAFRANCDGGGGSPGACTVAVPDAGTDANAEAGTDAGRDAGAPDAPRDSTTPPRDTGVDADATTIDSSVPDVGTPGRDTGTEPVPDEGGCSCRSAGHVRGPALPLLGLLGAVAFVRRSRRKS